MSNTRKRFGAQISVPVTTKMYDELNKRADLEQVTVSHITRVILEQALFGVASKPVDTQESNQ